MEIDFILLVLLVCVIAYGIFLGFHTFHIKQSNLPLKPTLEIIQPITNKIHLQDRQKAAQQLEKCVKAASFLTISSFLISVIILQSINYISDIFKLPVNDIDYIINYRVLPKLQNTVLILGIILQGYMNYYLAIFYRTFINE